MAVAAHLDTLAPIRDKVIAGERLDLDDGIALLECDDVLALGDLADTARRLRGGTDDVFFVNNLYLNHTNVCRVKCKFCAFARTGRQEGAYTWDIDDLVGHAVEVHGRESYDEIHMVGGEHPHIGYDYYPAVTRALKKGAPGRPHEAVHGVRDPPHDQALGEDARRGAGRPQGRRPGIAPRRRSGGLRGARPPAGGARQGAPGQLALDPPGRP